MKTKVNIKELAKEPTFPALYKHNSSPMVVLFTSHQTGTVIASKKGLNSLGFYNISWGSCENNQIWTRLSPGDSVELIQD